MIPGVDGCSLKQPVEIDHSNGYSYGYGGRAYEVEVCVML